jgi:hypothetical protein
MASSNLFIESIDPLERLKALVKAAERYQHCGCAGIELFREVEAAKGAINAASRRRRSDLSNLSINRRRISLVAPAFRLALGGWAH